MASIEPQLLYVLTWEYQDDHVVIGVYDTWKQANDEREKVLIRLKDGFLKAWVFGFKDPDNVRPFIMNMLDITTIQKNLTYYEKLG